MVIEITVSLMRNSPLISLPSLVPTKPTELLGRLLSGIVPRICRDTPLSSSSSVTSNLMISDKDTWVIAISSQVLLLLLKIQTVLKLSSLRISKIEKEIPTVAIVLEFVIRVNGKKSSLMNISLVFPSKEVLPSLRVTALKSGLCYSKRLGLRLTVLMIKSKLV